MITRYADRFIKVIGPCAGRRSLELSGRTELPSCVPLDEIRAPLVECILSRRRLVGTPSELYLRQNGFVLSAAIAEGLDDAPQLFRRTTGHRDKAIRPGADNRRCRFSNIATRFRRFATVMPHSYASGVWATQMRYYAPQRSLIPMLPSERPE